MTSSPFPTRLSLRSLPYSTRSATLPLLIGVAFLGACGGADDAATGEAMGDEMAAPEAPMVLAGVGFATPESALHDATADVYLVSNINGAPAEADGNGFISRIDPAGEVLDLRWIDGAADGVTLNAPKGMALSDGLLYVTDIDCIRMFDAATGEPAGERCVEGATFLNDLAPHPDGGVVFSDSGMDAAFESTGADAVYHLMGDAMGTVTEGAELGRPNGVAVRDGRALMVTFGTGEVYSFGEDGSSEVIAALEGGQLDGVEILPDGTVLISDWGSSCVMELTEAGAFECRIPDMEAPADIGYDATRDRVLIPLFNADELHIVPWG